MKAKKKPKFESERVPLQDAIPLDTPLAIFVDPSSACNFRCSFCPTGHRDLIADTGRFQGAMAWDTFTKVVDDCKAFASPVKLLRLYKDGEPFLNKRLADMVAYAKRSGHIERVDTITNGSLLTPERVKPVLDAGIDRISISVDGMSREHYKQVTGYDLDFDEFVKNVRWLYANKGSCEIAVKIIDDIVTEEQRKQFYDIFEDHCDVISSENLIPSWPEFDIEERSPFQMKGKETFHLPLKPKDVCTFIFYSIAVNADGKVSACLMDWTRKLSVGDVKTQSLKDIWHSQPMNDLRLQHLEGRARENPVCGQCGELYYCQMDNIDTHREQLLPKFAEYARKTSVIPAE